MNYILLIFLIIIIFLIIFNSREQIIGKPILLEDLDLKDTTSLFWTGGYDSTFRLCQLLIDERKKVQPIYLIYKYTDSDNPTYQRNSKATELQVMENIRQELFKAYPHTRELLKPVIYIYKIRHDQEATDKSLYIHYKLKQYSRPYTQYERLARFSLYYPTNIEIGLDKCGTGLDRATKGFRTGEGANCRIMANLPDKYRPLDVYRKFRFSIAHLDKKAMLDIARRGGYERFLKMSWSCWTPKSDGKPCGKCEMCQKRIVSVL